MRRASLLRLLALAVVAPLACTSAGENRVLGVAATGTVSGFALLDANGSRQIGAGSDSFPNARVRLVLKSGRDTGVVQTAQGSGFYRFTAVPVGEYAVTLDTTGFADSLRIVKVDSQSFTVVPAETVHVNILAGRPLVTVVEARALPVGSKVFVAGVALTSSASFADSTASFADTSADIRILRPRTVFAAGDSLRLLGTVGSRDSEPTFDDPTAFALGPGHLPTAVPLTSAAAATAAGGVRDAQIVSVHGAVVSDTQRATTSFVLTVSDGSGPLGVQLDQTADQAFTAASLPGNYVPGSKFDLLGVLVPTGSGAWRLRPRSALDLTLIPPPVISIRAARALPAGQTVLVVGVALNNTFTFSDTTVHLADTSDAIRLTRLRGIVAVGDSIKVKATTSSRAGQPTLDAGTATALGQGLLPTAPKLKTSVAATASGGTLDAAFVIVDSAVVSDTATILGAFRLTVSDGSGNLTVLLDQTAGFAVPGVYVPGSRFRIGGLLVPTGTGSWVLKPRSGSDLQKF